MFDPIAVDLKTARALLSMGRDQFNAHIRPRLRVYSRPGVGKHVRYADLLQALAEFEREHCAVEVGEPGQCKSENTGGAASIGATQRTAGRGTYSAQSTAASCVDLVALATRRKPNGN